MTMPHDDELRHYLKLHYAHVMKQPPHRPVAADFSDVPEDITWVPIDNTQTPGGYFVTMYNRQTHERREIFCSYAWHSALDIDMRDEG